MARWLRDQGACSASLWLRLTPERVWWEERAGSSKLSSDLYLWAVAHTLCTHLCERERGKERQKVRETREKSKERWGCSSLAEYLPVCKTLGLGLWQGLFTLRNPALHMEEGNNPRERGGGVLSESTCLPGKSNKLGWMPRAHVKVKGEKYLQEGVL